MRYLFLVIFLLGCAQMPGMPGHITKSVSDFDGSTQYEMDPAWVKQVIKFGLYRNTKMDKDVIVLIAVVKGLEPIRSGESLHFNVDGNIIDLESIDNSTDFEYDNNKYHSSHWSSKRYLINTEFMELILNAKRVIVKLDLDKKYIEDEFSSDVPMNAKSAFKKFMINIKN